MSYISQWMVRPVWKPTKREADVVHKIMGECIKQGFGVRQIKDYFNVRQHYIYENIQVKRLYREKRKEDWEKERLLEGKFVN